MKQKDKNKVFWLLQIISWSFLSLVSYFLLSLHEVYDLRITLLYILSYLLAVLMSSFILRYIYRYLLKNVKSILLLTVIVFFVVLFFITFYYFTDIAISMLWWSKERIQEFWQDITIINVICINYDIYLIFYGWTFLYFGIKYWFEWQDEKKRSEQAYHLAQQAQLQTLRYQLNPHFLFNSLNSIKALTDEDSSAAKQMITELSEFLRYSLINQDIAFRPLKEELDALKHYLAIEKKRYEEKLQINYDISPDSENLPVLGFLIHPIIENAIKYGMKTSKMPLNINIKSFHYAGFLTIEICNSGLWFERESMQDHYGTGTGLDNVKKRLENAYKDDFRFEVNKSEHKVCIIIGMNTNEQEDR